jgi:ElaB/YqjD/DUF883 family membrane-anchored ribosome-binding protein
MSNSDEAKAKLNAATSRAKDAIDSAKEYVANTDIDDIKAKAADAAGAVYKRSRELAKSDAVTGAADQLATSIRNNPLAAVGVAFTAGLVLALLTRG